MASLLLKQYSRLTHNDSRPTSADWALAPLVPFAHLYGLGMRARAALYANGILKQQALSTRVISVGNLSVGGAGKTPIVIALANSLLKKGRRVGVISRGYGRRREDAILMVSDGRSVLADPAETGDEPLLIAERCPGVPIAVGADRYRTGQYLLDRCDLDTVLLDDGFQHLALRREIDIVVLDTSEPFGDRYLLPRGRLREPISAVQRASLIVLTRAGQANNLPHTLGLVRRAAAGLPLCITDFTITTLCKLGGGQQESGTALRGQRVLAVSGIGNPASFERQLLKVGAVIVKHVVFPDHHGYTRENVRSVTQLACTTGADRIVTTEKDAVKLKCFEEISSQVVQIWAIRIEMEWLEGQGQWERIVLGG